MCRHQAGWFPFNLENELRLPGDAANPEDAEEEPQNQDLPETVATRLLRSEDETPDSDPILCDPVQDGAVEEASDDDDGDTGEEGAEDPNGAAPPGFLSSTWSFVVTFFMSLIPEGPPNAN